MVRKILSANAGKCEINALLEFVSGRAFGGTIEVYG